METNLSSGRHDLARGARLTAAMVSNGMLYNCQLCYDLGVTESSLSRWRSGGPMSVPMAVSLARKLGVSIDWLVTGSSRGAQPQSLNGQFGEAARRFALLSPMDRRLVLEIGRAMARLSVPIPSALVSAAS